MKKVAAIAALGLLLTGCAAQTNAEPAPVETVYVTQTPEPVETVEAAETTPGPIEVTPTPSETPSPEALMRELIENDAYSYTGATDDELMDLAHYVCDQRAAGVPQADIVAVSGEGVTDMMNDDFVLASLRRLCPENL